MLTAVPAYITAELRPKFHLLFLQNSFILKKVLHLKDLYLIATDVSFNHENGAFSKIRKWHTDGQTDKATTVIFPI